MNSSIYIEDVQSCASSAMWHPKHANEDDVFKSTRTDRLTTLRQPNRETLRMCDIDIFVWREYLQWLEAECCPISSLTGYIYMTFCGQEFCASSVNRSWNGVRASIVLLCARGLHRNVLLHSRYTSYASLFPDRDGISTTAQFSPDRSSHINQHFIPSQ